MRSTELHRVAIVEITADNFKITEANNGNYISIKFDDTSLKHPR